MSLIAALEAMVEAGATPAMMLAVARRMEAAREAELADRRAKDAARKRKPPVDSTEIRGNPRNDTESAKPSPHVRGRDAQVVITTSSSLQSEEGTQEANASFVDASSANTTPAPPEKPKTKPPKAGRGTRLPEDWEPTETDMALARKEGLTDEEITRAALEFRNYWCARSRDATRLSWPRTWHNRVIQIGERKRRDGPRLASASGQPGAGGRGTVSFADLYARRHGTGAG